MKKLVMKHKCDNCNEEFKCIAIVDKHFGDYLSYTNPESFPEATLLSDSNQVASLTIRCPSCDKRIEFTEKYI